MFGFNRALFHSKKEVVFFRVPGVNWMAQKASPSKQAPFHYTHLVDVFYHQIVSFLRLLEAKNLHSPQN